jgi:L-lactate dehydrogenase complex protein LldG
LVASTGVSSAREEILGRIRGALRDVPGPERPDDVVVTREYRTRAEVDPGFRLERFAERISDYRAEFRRVAPAEIPAALTDACSEMGLGRVVVPSELPTEWRPHGVEVIEDHGLSARELDAIDGAITGCAVAIAETGTLVLDGQGVCGRRIVTLVPDHHICVVRPEQVVSLVPEAVASLQASVAERGAPVTLISGPSASSDIELRRVEGVHGPRHLLVFLATA